jgi:hypothetical protein
MYPLRLVLFVVASVVAAIVHVGAAAVVIADLIDRDPRLALALGPLLEIIIALSLFTMGSELARRRPRRRAKPLPAHPGGGPGTSPRRSVDAIGRNDQPAPDACRNA